MYIKFASGEVYKTLIDGVAGSWIISCERPNAPIYVNRAEMDAGERVEEPSTHSKGANKKLSKAAVMRLTMIQPLLDDDKAIMNEVLRREIATRCAEEFNTTRRTVLRLYYRYLATGTLTRPKNREIRKIPLFDSAIRHYYFTAKKHSLRTTYELMILDNYCDAEGKITADAPSFNLFRKYYYRHWSTNKRKLISRNGLTKYQRDNRMLYGSAMAYRDNIGTYQIDETTADIYLVSDYDRSKVIGRPNIYMATDTVTGMITGVYVGFDAGETALMRCIANASLRKDKYCAEYGIDISTEDWNCVGLPTEIMCDRGKEFVGKRTEELCKRYGVIINSAPPFRAELKPLIERMIGLIQESYKSTLQGRGIINGDSQERWAIDYREQAILTLEEYTKIVITTVITLNKSRIISNLGHLPVDAPHTPAALWDWFTERGKSKLLTVNEEDIYVMSLPRTTGTVSRMGILHNRLRYVPVYGQSITIGAKVVFAYDDQCISYIYVITADGYVKCHLAQSSERYKGYSSIDVKLMRNVENKEIKTAKENELGYKIKMRRDMRDIIQQAEKEKARCKP